MEDTFLRHADDLRRRGEFAWHHDGDASGALHLLDASLGASETAAALLDKADILVDNGRPHEALECYDRGIAIRPTSEALFNKALLLHEMGRLDEALATLSKCKDAVEQQLRAEGDENGDTQDDGVVAEMAYVLAHMGKFEEALGIVLPLLPREEATGGWELTVCAWRVLAKCPERKAEAVGHARKAVETLEVTTRGNGDASEEYALARSLETIGAKDKAAEHYRSALGTLRMGGAKCETAAAAHDAAKCLFRLGRMDDAAMMAGHALELRGWFPKASLLLARALCAIGRVDDAAAAANQALAQRPGHRATVEFLNSLH